MTKLTIENGHRNRELHMLIFHRYVSLPEGNENQSEVVELLCLETGDITKKNGIFSETMRKNMMMNHAI